MLSRLTGKPANRQTQQFKNRRILITAGPTWVPIDGVRVISNIASGQTGILLAEKLRQLGAEVTLIMGPVSTCCLHGKLKISRFRFFDELKKELVKELKTKQYDAVIHSAAVSDYQLKHKFNGKLKSGRKSLKIALEPTEKIINLIKKIDSKVFLVGFKFELNMPLNRLFFESQKLLKHSGADLVVANTILDGKYKAYLVDKEGLGPEISSKEKVADKLIKKVGFCL